MNHSQGNNFFHLHSNSPRFFSAIWARIKRLANAVFCHSHTHTTKTVHLTVFFHRLRSISHSNAFQTCNRIGGESVHCNDRVACARVGSQTNCMRSPLSLCRNRLICNPRDLSLPSLCRPHRRCCQFECHCLLAMRNKNKMHCKIFLLYFSIRFCSLHFHRSK